MHKTAEDMLYFWDWVQQNDERMNPGTAGAIRNACAKVLEGYGDLADLNVEALDLELAVQRFKL